MNHRRRAAQPREPTRRPSEPAVVVDEVAAVISGEIRRAMVVAAERAHVLESISRDAAEATEVFHDAPAGELYQRAHRIRGIALHALATLADLQAVAGRLETLAALREAEAAADRSA